MRHARPLVEVVVPVHNEERALEASIWRLHGYLTAHFPFAFRITVADTGTGIPPELVERYTAIALRIVDHRG